MMFSATPIESSEEPIEERGHQSTALPSTIIDFDDEEDETNLDVASEYEPTDKKLSQSVNFEQCEWIKKLLSDNISIGEPLPEPGKSRPGGNVFWLKRPLLHTKALFDSIPTFQGVDAKPFFSKIMDGNGEVELMVLKYNVYNPKWTQHTEKFTNTINTLKETTLSGLNIFPQMFGFCSDVEGFHTIVVEYIPYETGKLPPPETLYNCVKRADDALHLFEELERMGKVLVDFKKGQWMSRGIEMETSSIGIRGAEHKVRSSGMILQDVDDIVPVDSKNPYKEQVEWFQNGLVQELKMPIEEIKRIWEANLFPKGQYNIRYDVFGFDILLNDLGFKWKEKYCLGITTEFKSCLDKLLARTKDISENWLHPADVREELWDCYTKYST